LTRLAFRRFFPSFPLVIHAAGKARGRPFQNQVLMEVADHTPENIMVVVRESIGANREHESLEPIGPATAVWPETGEPVAVEIAAYHLLGDVHVRFVFDGPKYMRGLKPNDLLRFDLSPQRALKLALGNIRRVYGEPRTRRHSGTIRRVQGGCADFDSSYFLHRDFWRRLLRRHPAGLVVAIPSRSDLLYTPLADRDAVERLRRSVVRLYSLSDQQRVSSALFLFEDDTWTVFQAPQPEDD
jgi:hypothetical protein